MKRKTGLQKIKNEEKEVEKELEKVAEELHVEFPISKVPFGVKLIALFMLIGGLSLMGTAFTDIFGLRVGAWVILFRTVIGAMAIIISYGLIKKFRWALWFYGGFLMVTVFVNPILSIVYILILVYLLNNKHYFKKGAIDNWLEKIFYAIVGYAYEKIKQSRQLISSKNNNKNEKE